jgi:hypothetical protein
MRLRTKFMILGSVAMAAGLATPGPGAAQALSRPDGWRTQAERFVPMRPGFHITTTPSVLLNGETVLTLPRGELALDGVTGFRVGAGLNLHLTTLDVASDSGTRRWAPAREADEAADADVDGGTDS